MEADLWTTLSNKMGHRWHASRVESHSTSPGIPDVDYCMEGFKSNLELKHTHKKKRPKIRNSQVRWHHRRAEHGGHSLILTHFDLQYEDIYMFHLGKDARRLAVEDFPYWRGKAIWVFNDGSELDVTILSAILRNEL